MALLAGFIGWRAEIKELQAKLATSDAKLRQKCEALGRVESRGAELQTQLECERRALASQDDRLSNMLARERAALAVTQNPRVIQTLKVPNVSDRLGDIRCPTLSLWGLNEKMMPDSGIMKLAKGLKNGRMVLVPNCGHWVMIEHRELFNRTVIDFLEHG